MTAENMFRRFNLGHDLIQDNLFEFWIARRIFTGDTYRVELQIIAGALYEMKLTARFVFSSLTCYTSA